MRKEGDRLPSSVLIAVLLLCFGFIVPLVMVEGGMRLYAWMTSGEDLSSALASSEQSSIAVDNPSLKGLVKQSTNPQIVYELKSNMVGTFLRQPLRTNQFGMRGPECSLTKPEGTLRVAVVGDSIAFGWGVKEEERYSSILAEKLAAARGGPVEVLNFAVPGYNAMIEAALIEQKVSQFRPDILILHFVNNDDSAPYFMTRPESYTTLQKSFLVTWIRERLDTSKKVVNPNLSTGFGSLPAETKKAVMQEYAYMVGPKAVSTALTRIGSWAQSKQVPLYIVFGSLKDGQYSLLRQVAKRTDAKLVGVKEAVERYFTERGIVTPEERFKELTLNPKDPHPNAKGHQIYAEALFEAISQP